MFRVSTRRRSIRWMERWSRTRSAVCWWSDASARSCGCGEPQFVTGDAMMKRVIAATLFLLTITPAIAQSADVALRFDCSAFTHILWACLPPSAARDSANAMASAFMSEAIRLGRERHMSDGKLNTVAMAALQRQRAKTGNTCSRLDALVRNYGNLCDALMDSQRADTERLKHPGPTAAAN
jgi:hypothetical protein